MAKIAYLLLCHKNPDRVLEQARVLSGTGDYVAIHVDSGAPQSFYDTIRSGTADNPSVVLSARVTCGWGEWSLVKATLNMVKAAHRAFADATHFFLISGDCMPIKTSSYIRTTLDGSNQDMIEHADFFDDDWIKTGMKEDRLIRRHWFNERSQRGLFYASLGLQRRLGIKRDIPANMRMRIGSQWWVLRRSTIDAILEFLGKNAAVLRFFKTTWIPDETFFQTLTMHLVPRDEVVSRPPTLLMFSDYGMPVTFYGDHFDMLKSQDSLFARKISDHDDGLRGKLGDLFLSDDPIPQTSGSGRKLYDYVRSRGREGRRYAGRIWEAGATIGPGYDLTLVVCKKWHVADRLIATLQAENLMPAFGYVFDQDHLPLPELGNLESSRDKRGRHRRAFLRLLYQSAGSRRLAICLDPSNNDAIRDFAGDGCTLRVLELDVDISDDWLSGHAERVGLGAMSDRGALNAGLMATLRQNILDEQGDLAAMRLPGHVRIRQGAAPGQMARPLADAFGISVDAGAKLARTEHLFED